MPEKASLEPATPQRKMSAFRPVLAARRGRPTTKFTTQNGSQACELLLRAKLVPDRAGASTQVIAHIPLSELRQLPGAPALEDAWIPAWLGEDGYLTGKDAETASCDALTLPAVTGAIDPGVIDQMINLARTAAQAHAQAGGPGAAGPAPAGDDPAAAREGPQIPRTPADCAA